MGVHLNLQARTLRRIAASSAVGALVVGAAVTLSAPASAVASVGCTPGSCTATFSYTGATETFTVPAGVTALTVTVSGAQGGRQNYIGNFAGAQGATVGGVMPVNPGQLLTVLVGRAGTNGGGATFGGGGASYPNSSLGSGGGGSFLFDTTGRLLVAAGGGGGAAGAANTGGAGAGAGATGGSGVAPCCQGGTPPTGGSSTAGGARGSNSNTTHPGTGGTGPAAATSPGTGGSGGSGNFDSTDHWGGAGGGGGYYGGGGGGYTQGGGGGSGYADASITGLNSTSGVNSGNGAISIAWGRQATTVALVSSPSTGGVLGASVTLSASVTAQSGTPSGAIEFDVNGTVIAGCSAQPLSNGAATCTTTALPVGPDTLQAAYLGDTVYAPTTSAPASFAVAYPALTVTTTSVPAGTVDTPYSTTLAATGGLAPYVWTISAGSLPNGLTLSSSGTLAGTPSAATSGMPFTAQATDSQGNAYTATKALTITVGKASQTINFTSTAPSGRMVGDAYLATATGGPSGQDVTFSVDGATTNSACSISGSTFSFDHVGTCVIDADQIGTADYTAAPTRQQQIAVGIAAQAINFTSIAPSDAAVGGSYSPVVSRGASSQSVVLSIASGSAGVCSVLGTTVSFNHVGTCVIEADQAGSADYTAAPTAQQSVSVAAADTTVALTSSASPSVFGQPIHDTATVTAGFGSPAGAVQFAVGGTDFGAPVTLVNGSAQSADLTGVLGDSLTPGAHPITASFTADDATVYADAAISTAQVIDQAASSTHLATHTTTISAAVTAIAPGAGTPTGTVSFSVAGTSVGTAPVLDGAATLTYTVAAGQTQQVAAAYGGDADFTGSSVSAARLDPSITATVTSAHPRSRYGWYRAPVRVTFHCTSTGAALTQPCPGSALVSSNRAGQSVTRTIAAADGGMATVNVRGINIDRIAPTVRVTGIHNGATYGGSAPAARCSGHDALSGLASCTLSRHTSSGLTRYTVRATDKAGNSTSASGSYRTLTIRLQGATYSHGAFAIHTGRTYLLVAYATSRPTYYDAAVYPRTPTRKDLTFHADGHNRWSLRITMTASLRNYPYWNLGIKIGSTMHVIKIHVS